MSNKIVYFDLDGVLADWVKAFESASGMPIEDFNALSSEERNVIKEDLVDYDFFYGLEVIESGRAMYHNLVNFLPESVSVEILSAHGDVKCEEVMEAKRAWVAKHFGEDLPVSFVRKVVDKVAYVGNGNILIDDREKAIVAWENAGGIGYLFS